MASGNLTWRKSSYSNGDGGDCLEVADGAPEFVPVRDSKNTDGPVLRVRDAHWAALVRAVAAGTLG
ncbi:DUF397 domain-containing protein [Streptomyces sp. DW26H14]|uniref:DUF397 domain-containing protein n=1 Tax=Streptomyces sp. DW26H14 TaxID=3435395 RepID=UPI00403DB8BA